MKKIFMALAVVAIFFAWSNNVSAAVFTQEQVDKIMNYVDQNPAASPENTSALKLTPEQLKEKFNAELKPVLDKTKFENDEERATMEKVFLIQDFQIFEEEGGKFYLNIFGDGVAVLGMTGNNDDNFKLASCAYINPETQGEKVLSSLVLLSFVKAVAPEENPQNLLETLAAEQSGTLTRNGIKFSAVKDGNLILLSAVAE